MKGMMMATVIDRKIDEFRAGEYIFDITADAGQDPGPVRIPAQEFDYKVRVFWGGHDKANGTPDGDIQLVIGMDIVRHTNMLHHPQPGDSDDTWRWDGVMDLKVPAGETKRFSVAHNTRNSAAQNTYLRIQFVASN